MRVINRHKRIIHQPKEKLSQLLETIATSQDQIWPHKNWPKMRFKQGVKIGSKGGHGRVRYTIIELQDGNNIKFNFTKPDGFKGTHELRINSVSKFSSEIVHTITMNTTFKASLLWIFVIRWLHNALIKEAFDGVENHFSVEKKKPTYSLWVKALRALYKRNTHKTTLAH